MRARQRFAAVVAAGVLAGVIGLLAGAATQGASVADRTKFGFAVPAAR
jgi:hypothetical protein